MFEHAPDRREWGTARKQPTHLIAVIGLGAMLPGARNVPEFWQNVREGRDSVVEVPKDRWDPAIFYDPDPDATDKSYGKNGGFILDLPFDTREFRIPPRTLAVMDRSQKMVLTAALEAMRDSGYHEKAFDKTRTAVILGNAGGRTENETAASWTIQLPLFEETIREKLLESGYPSEGIRKLVKEFRSRMLEGLPEVNEDTLPCCLRNVAVGRVASHFNLQGPSYVVDAACASGLAALDFAVDGLIEREYDLALSGAFYASLEPMFFAGFSKFKGLSRDRVKPFDADADGFVGGEGACIFVLKRLADAVRDHDRIYAVLRGIGSSSDGREKGISAPNPAGQALAMRRAFEQAGYAPDTVQLVETHGAGTPLGDVSEFQATREVFGCRSGEQGLWLTAVKSQIGHVMGAAGAAGTLKTVLGLYHKLLPPTINHVNPRKELPWQETGFRVVTKCEPWPENAPGLPRRANVSSFGFGGNNFHAAFEEYLPPFHARLIEEQNRRTTSGATQAGGLDSPRSHSGRSSPEEARREPIAVIGLGANLPQSSGVDAVWETILKRRDMIRPIAEDRWNGKSRFYAGDSGGDGPKVTSLLGGYIDHPVFDSRRFRIPPASAQRMDPMQKLFMQTALAALDDAGYADGQPFDRQRTAVLLGASPGCHDTLWAGQLRPNALRARFHLKRCDAANSLGLKGEAMEKLLDQVDQALLSCPPLSEESVLAICMQIGAARFAKALDLMGTHCNVDAACGSSLASVALAVRGLQTGKWDMVVVGGASEGMSPLTLVTFSLAGVISRHTSRPFDSSADGFVPGEGSVVFVLKRLSEAIRDRNRIYAVIRGLGASSDGRGRSMMAPRPEGQALSLQRAYADAGYGQETVDLVECHATATPVGDPAELEALRQVFGNGERGRVGIGSAKSQFGHLIGAAGATGLLKAVLALHHKILPPTINVSNPNPELRLEDGPFYLLTEPREWIRTSADFPRRAGVSSFGFGGTNWHVTLEEFDPAYHKNLVATAGWEHPDVSKGIPPAPGDTAPTPDHVPPPSAPAIPTTGIFAIGATSLDELKQQLRSVQAELDLNGKGREAGAFVNTPPLRFGDTSELPFRLAIVAANVQELSHKITLAGRGLGEPKTALILEAQGIYMGQPRPVGSDGRLCFLFPGQGPQYPDMWRQLFDSHTEVSTTFHEADATLVPLLGARLEQLIFTSGGNAEEVEARLLNSEIVQPALLTANIAMYRLLAGRGVTPDIFAGHSLGEYSALVAGGVMDFASALRAVHVRGREFRKLSERRQDPGLMAMITASEAEIEPVLRRTPGYVVIANRNCAIQTVISGASPSVRAAVATLEAQGIECRILPIGGAFHSALARAIVPAMKEILEDLQYRPPVIPVLSSVTGGYYQAEGIREQTITNLLAQLSSPVDFLGLVNRLQDDGVRTYLEVGPKKALSGFVDDILGSKPHRSLFSNHPKIGENNQLHRLLAHLFAIGYPVRLTKSVGSSDLISETHFPITPPTGEKVTAPEVSGRQGDNDMKISGGDNGKQPGRKTAATRVRRGGGETTAERIVITGASVGLPGRNQRVFSDQGIFRLLDGHSLIDSLNPEEQDLIVGKNVTRVVKGENGDSYFQKVDDRKESIKLAARRGQFQLADFGLDQDWLQDADVTDQIAVAVGMEGLKDAGIPLQRSYRQTTTGRSIPTGWLLPEQLRADTGVIFASIYSGVDKLLGEVSRYYKATLGPLAADGLRAVYHQKLEAARSPEQRLAADQWFSEEIRRLELPAANGPYEYNRELMRSFTCKGNALLAQVIGARGPNLHVNSACASHTVALGLAEDMLRTGRARRVIVLAADDITSDRLLEWMGTGFLALGAAATDQEVCDCALPFDRRRHGLVLGMGASAIVVETESAARERGMTPIAELLGVHVSNSAFHLSRLDPDHIAGEMEQFLNSLDDVHGVTRQELAAKTLFMSHETYTPARGGSAQAEVQALKAAFGTGWREVVVANTKGMTGHCQGAGIEDVVALKALQFGVVPPIVNFEEQDPELEGINLSRGGRQDLDFALGFAAGFGSHVSMFLARAMGRGSDRISDPGQYRRWLADVTGLADPRILVAQRTLRVESADGAALATEIPQAGLDMPTTTTSEQRAGSPAPGDRSPGGAAVASVAATGPGIQPVQVPPPSRPPEAPARPTEAEVREVVLRLFEEKTGYERELLDLDLDLEADLGIDTIKQAQIFAAIRDKYGLAREEGVRLKDYPTLRRVMEYIASRAASETAASPATAAAVKSPSAEEPALKAPVIPAAPVIDAPPQPLHAVPEIQPSLHEAPKDLHTEAVTAPVPSGEQVLETVLRLVEEKTGYEREFLDLDLDLEADLGIDTIKQAQILGSIRERYDLPREEGIRLKDFPTLRHVVGYISGRVANSATTQPSVPAPSSLASTADYATENPLTPLESAACAAPTKPRFASPGEETPDRVTDEVDSTGLQPAAAALRAPQAPAPEPPPPKPPVPEPPGPEPPGPEPPGPEPPSAKPDRWHEVQEMILSMVEEKTGYEREFLELDLDLEADLGIDTIKQAQILGAIREHYNLAREEGVRLKDFPTLRHVIGYISRRLESGAEPSEDSKAGAATGGANDLSELPVEWSDIRRWAVTCPPTPATSDREGALQPGSGSIVLVTDDGGGVATALQKRLAKRGVKTILLTNAGRGGGPGTFTVDFEDLTRLPDIVKEIQQRHGFIDGLIHLFPLAGSRTIDQMDLAEWRRTTARDTKSLFMIAKALSSQPAKKGRRFLVAATTLGGRFGFGIGSEATEAASGPPSHGGVAGFVKAFSKEAEGWVAKVIDFDQAEALGKPEAIADPLLGEILSGDPAVEVGIRQGIRSVPVLSYAPVDLSRPSQIKLDRSSVVLLFGGARGVTGQVAQALSRRFGCRLVLVGTTELPPQAEDAQDLTGEGLGRYRKRILEDLRKRDPKATPARAEIEIQKRLRAAEIQRTIESLRRDGTEVNYETCDVRDPGRMARLLDEVSARLGRLDGIVYGAGVIEDKLLEDKGEESFSRVFDVKADGIFNLYRALKGHPALRPRFIAAFSSIAGRFGNRGQADYSAGNETLAKFMGQLGRLLPETRCFAIDWTAWAEVGLPARSGLADMMKEQGMDLIRPIEGAAAFVDELCYGNGPEAVYAGRLPGFTDAVAITVPPDARLPEPPPGLAPLLDDIREYRKGAWLRAHRTIHPQTDLWLGDHVIEGTPLVPGVLGVEMMVEAARLLFPDFHFVGVDDLRILLAVKILKNRPVTLQISAQAHSARRPDDRVVLVRIESDFIDPQGRPLGETRRHYEATVLLSRVKPSPARTQVSIADSGAGKELSGVDIYGEGKLLPHGPVFRVLRTMRTMADGSAVGSVAPISENLLCPALNGHRFSTLPLAREAGFQVAGLWAILKPGILSLPHGCRRLRHFGAPPANTRLLARTTNFRVSDDAIECDLEILAEDGTVYDRMEGYYAVSVARISRV